MKYRVKSVKSRVDPGSRATRGRQVRGDGFSCELSLRIIRLYEIQAIRRGVEAEGGAVFCFEGGAQVCRGPFALADERQAAHHRADLVMEEGAGARLNDNAVAIAVDIEAVKSFDWASRLAMNRAERREVTMADKDLCGVMHRFRIQC